MRNTVGEQPYNRIIIKADVEWHVIDWRELWQYRELFFFSYGKSRVQKMTIRGEILEQPSVCMKNLYPTFAATVFFLVWRDIKTLYSQSILGFIWAIVPPLFGMVVFTVVFGKLAKISSDGVPYAIFSYAALVPWGYFAGSMTSSSSSLTGRTEMVSKVYIPRLIIPIAPVLAKLVDFCLAMMLLGGLMAWFRIVPTTGVLILPLLILLMILTAAGLGMWLTALAAQYRDVQYGLGLIVQMLQFASPVIYPTSLVPEPYRLLYALNPMVGVIEGFRSALLNTNSMPWDLLLVGTATAVLIASSGILYFQRTERIFPAYRTNFFGCDITMSDIAIRDDDYMSDIIWALNDVSFEVKRGEVVGLIGRNGAGKSTLLKILSRVTHPSRGQIELYGRLASLLEVGTGFHPELTGRENIYMNSAILGMKKAEIDRKFDEIVDFSGVEKFIDTPVKRYSSGMRARLGFSVAAYLESEIMIVDEVLSVGDVAFRRKSQDKMRNAAQTGRTVLFVSHNLTMISALCQRVLYLKNGKLEIDADTEKSIARYVMDMENLTQTPLSERTGREGSGHVQITNLRWLDAKTLSPLECVRTGQEVYLEISYETASIHQKVMDSLEVNISIRTELDQVVIVLNSRLANNAFDQRLPSTGQLYCHLERFPLMTGRYFGQYAIRLNGILADRVRNAFTLEVELGDFFGTGQVNHGIRQSVCVPQTWLVDI